MFYTNEILQIVVTNTNASIKCILDKIADKILDKDTHLKDIEMTELLAFIGLMYVRVATNKNLVIVKDLFTHKRSPDIFQTCISYRRFNFLTSVTNI